MKKRSLGKSLNTIYEIIEFTETIEHIKPSDIDNIFKLPIKNLIPNRYQPRRNFEHRELQELADSINGKGMLQPILVREHTLNKYEIVAGERRWLAAQLVGLDEVPVVILDIDERLSLIYNLVENLQRKDLNPIEQANAFWRLQQEFKFTHEQIANHVSSSRVAVTNILRLLSLPEEIKNLIQREKLDLGHARALIGLGYNQQLSLAKKIVKNNMTVREVESRVQKIKNYTNSQKRLDSQNINNKKYSEQLTTLLSTKVVVNLDLAGKGKITIDVNSKGQVEELIELLKS